MLDTLTGPTHGQADTRLSAIVDSLDEDLTNDPDYSFQAAAYHRGEKVLDVWGGPHIEQHSVLVPFSVTKITIGLSIALLIQRGQLDLDRAVAHYWPEFAAQGKGEVTVRVLLSHQAGLPQTDPPLSWAELLDHHAGAERLAATRPMWHPGSAFGYHAFTIGNLASELVFRITGLTLGEFYERELRAPNDIDFYLGLPPEHDARRVDLLPFILPLSHPEPPSELSLGKLVFMGAPGPAVDLGNDEVSWRFGHPAVSGTGSARGLARLFAATVTGLEGREAVLSAETISIVGQQQVSGYDEVLGAAHRAYGVVFQKPVPGLQFGGPRSFGHDGARGALACVDPEIGVSFAYTVPRGPWPGGADPRAVDLAANLNTILAA